MLALSKKLLPVQVSDYQKVPSAHQFIEKFDIFFLHTGTAM